MDRKLFTFIRNSRKKKIANRNPESDGFQTLSAKTFLWDFQFSLGLKKSIFKCNGGGIPDRRQGFDCCEEFNWGWMISLHFLPFIFFKKKSPKREWRENLLLLNANEASIIKWAKHLTFCQGQKQKKTAADSQFSLLTTADDRLAFNNRKNYENIHQIKPNDEMIRFYVD